MLPKNRRLNLTTDFKRVAAGQKIETKYLKLFIKPGENNFAMVGIAASGKVFKNAAARNRAKRLVSQAFQSIYRKLPAAINIVALPKAGVINVKSDDVLKELEFILKNEKIIT